MKITQTDVEIHSSGDSYNPPNTPASSKRPPPAYTLAMVDRPRNNIGALQKLTSFDASPKVVRRWKKVARAYY